MPFFETTYTIFEMLKSGKRRVGLVKKIPEARPIVPAIPLPLLSEIGEDSAEGSGYETSSLPDTLPGEGHELSEIEGLEQKFEDAELARLTFDEKDS